MMPTLSLPIQPGLSLTPAVQGVCLSYASQPHIGSYIAAYVSPRVQLVSNAYPVGFLLADYKGCGVLSCGISCNTLGCTLFHSAPLSSLFLVLPCTLTGPTRFRLHSSTVAFHLPCPLFALQNPTVRAQKPPPCGPLVPASALLRVLTSRPFKCPLQGRRGWSFKQSLLVRNVIPWTPAF
jgi:hypothetical protein